jgi:hypothetical protein
MALDDYNCAICSLGTDETLLHLFLDCPFAVSCWATLGLVIQDSTNPFQTITSFKNQLAIPFSMEVIISMCWAIWSVRNYAIFKNVQPTISNARRYFRAYFAQVILRAKKTYLPFISQWPEAYV